MAELAGLVLDPWQQFVVRKSLCERPDGKWAAFEVGQVVPRQNGKGGVLEARELAGLFLVESERLIVHTAHEFPTAMEHFLRIRQLIENSPELSAQVKSITTSNGKEGIELKDGSRLRFKARTKGGGRGFSGDLVVLDEAYELTTAQLRALLPTMSARPNPQIWYASTAVDQSQHPNGVVLARVRERGTSGQNADKLAYFEWSVDDKTFWDDPAAIVNDPEMWAVANPALGIRITPEYVTDELSSLDLTSFAVERLGVGDWPATSDDGEPGPIDTVKWADLVDVRSSMVDPVVFGVDVTPDRQMAAIGVAGFRDDGQVHLEVVDHRAGTGWVAGRLMELIGRWAPGAVVLDGRSPAASLVPVLERAGVDPGLLHVTTAGEMAAACGLMFDGVEQATVRHLGQPPLDEAVRVVQTRTLGDAFAWARPTGGDISPLVAVTLAYGAVQKPVHEAAVPFAVRL